MVAVVAALTLPNAAPPAGAQAPRDQASRDQASRDQAAPQRQPPATRRVHLSAGAGAVGLVTHARPAFDGRAYTEGYLTQPVVMGALAAPWLADLRLLATISLEGATLDRGELNAGIYGEGYVDRRHPHTLAHEMMASVGGTIGGGRAGWSAAAGKGFVPFGSDDPMSRPFVKFPVNHHHAQILERWVAAAGARFGPALVELAAFNGDEPVGPYRWPSAGRFGDSWAARVTVLPAGGVELSASGALVESPEHVDGEGLDQRKLHVGARLERGAIDSDGWRYGLAEYGVTEDRSLGRLAHRYHTVLVEGGAGLGRWALAVRGELTDRPEEHRLVDPFRSPRPHGDGSVLGVTRWAVGTASVSRRVDLPWGLAFRPFGEVAHLRARPRARPAAFEPALFYGRDRMWSLSAGLRVGWGMRHARMGRYGVAAAAEHHDDAHHDDAHHDDAHHDDAHRDDAHRDDAHHEGGQHE